MTSHIFTRSGYWHESAATNLRGWHVSEDDVKRAHHTIDIIAAQYKALSNKELDLW